MGAYVEPAGPETARGARPLQARRARGHGRQGDAESARRGGAADANRPTGETEAQGPAGRRARAGKPKRGNETSKLGPVFSARIPQFRQRLFRLGTRWPLACSQSHRKRYDEWNGSRSILDHSECDHKACIMGAVKKVFSHSLAKQLAIYLFAVKNCGCVSEGSGRWGVGVGPRQDGERDKRGSLAPHATWQLARSAQIGRQRDRQPWHSGEPL